MNLATQILLYGKPFRITDFFRMGQVGWHWQIDDPLKRVGIPYEWVDTAGTTPTTAVGQGIGLLLGREYGGATGPSLLANGATGLTGTATAASYNTSTFVGSVSRAGDASNQSWVTWTGLTTSAVHRIRITNTGATSLDVRNGGVAGTIVASIAAGASTWVHPATTGGSTSITITATNNSTTATFTLGQFAVLPGTHLTQATGTAKPTLSARVNLLLSTATMSTQNVTTLAAGYRLRFEGTGTVTLSGTVSAGPLSAGTHNVTATAGTLTLTVSGSVTLADLRTADDAAKNLPAYQRVGATAADHDTDGFPHYAEGDGTDNCWASVATVDGSATDKLTVVAAATKLSDAATSVLMELGNSGSSATDGSFNVLLPTNAGLARIGATTRGTVAPSFVANNSPYLYGAPTTMVLSPQFNNSAATAATQATMLVNGGAMLSGPTTDGIGPTSPGNFANLTLNVMSRGGTSLRVNGRFYGSTGRFGPMGDSERTNLTRWWQKRIGTA